MEERINRHIIVNTIVTIAVLGLIVESIFEEWEFWVPPLLFIGLLVMWALHVSESVTEVFREYACLSFALLAALFHGVHESSFFDVVVITLLLLTTFTLLCKPRMLDIILCEFFVLMGIQIFLAVDRHDNFFTNAVISRCALHLCAAICAYFACKEIVRLEQKANIQQAQLAEILENTEKDREDFLANISHELRTPINVVNGMSSLILKTENREDVEAIRKAGLRLACQVEDIQDYTDLQRRGITIEESKYMITSLVNDVITSINLQEKIDKIEFIVDLDPNVPTMLKGDIKKLHKILRHILDNAIKFTNEGGIYIRVSCIKRDYGINLILSVSDTGTGMSRKELASASKGLYQANKKRNRSTGGIGLGLAVVYGFVREMNGFVKLESEKHHGTTISISVPQKVIDSTPCLKLENEEKKNVLFHVRTEKYKVPAVRDFYRNMAITLAEGLKCNLYNASNIKDVTNYINKIEVNNIFMGVEEYLDNASFFDELSHKDVVVAVTAPWGFKVNPGSQVIVIPKPLYGFPVVRVLNGGKHIDDITTKEEKQRPVFEGIRALIVDDEPMNLVVASGLFRDYKMIADTAASGREAIRKFEEKEYDIVFMDHMMPGMDGVEAMKIINQEAKENNREIISIAFTANVVSGAREMFINEGFDAVINKPIDIRDFERTMIKVLPQSKISYERRASE